MQWLAQTLGELHLHEYSGILLSEVVHKRQKQYIYIYCMLPWQRRKDERVEP